MAMKYSKTIWFLMIIYSIKAAAIAATGDAISNLTVPLSSDNINEFKCGIPVYPIRDEWSFGKAVVIGGHGVNPHSHPWQSLLLVDNVFECGGSVINIGNDKMSNVVVTAAHCIKYKDQPGAYSVRLGTHNRSDWAYGEKQIAVDKIIVHPQYQETDLLNDIALLRLEVPIYFTKEISSICLPSTSALVNHGYGLVTGWGDTTNGGRKFSDILMQVNVSVIDSDTCVNNYREDFPIYQQQMICAGWADGKKDSCSGDSGGPFIMRDDLGRYVLTGIVSFGKQCALPKKPGVYTRVSNYVHWISDTILGINQ